MSTQGASTSSPSSSSTPRGTYDVFLSFRGEDTRKGFTDHLYNALKNKGIFTFRDDEELERGKSISQELKKAIEESRSAIVIFSKNYASSTWCLDELVYIVRCSKEKGLKVFPIFYNVDPSDVRKQNGTFAEAFDKYKESFKERTVETWRSTLTEVANLSGWDLQKGHESKFIEDIVENMMKNLGLKCSRIKKNLIGIESKVAELIPLYLDFGNNVCMIGICGMGGMGKTTLARAVYDMYSDQFEVSGFIADIREKSGKDGLLHLQEQFLEEIFGERNSKIWDIHKGVEIIENRLRHKKILLVLDDVDHVDQLENLAERHWFGLGSWIIITTRDEHVLVKHGVPKLYKPKGLNNDDALKLFCLKAFKNEQPKEDYMQLSQEVVKYASGLPLALVTLGSFLIGRTIEEWHSALEYFENDPTMDIFDILKISYDGLDVKWKGIFLDIACFFTGSEKNYVIRILENCGFHAIIGIRVLMDKSLLTLTYKNDNEYLGMHDLLKEMGQKIVRQQSCGELGMQSRLWLVEDLFCVLENNMATNAIQAIVIRNRNADFNFEEFPEIFSKMSNLRLLIIDVRHISIASMRVPNGLRHLSWNFYSLKCLPSSFQPKELVELDLPHSKCEYLWEGAKCLGKLKSINLFFSNNLIRTPDFSGVPRLEVLHLDWCNNLVGFHPSIGQLSKLKSLSLKLCKSLTNLPSLSAKMESLTSIDLSGCSKIKKIPEFKGTMKRLSQLILASTAIEELSPSSIECLTALEILDLKGCKDLKCLPSNMDSLRSLKFLDLSGCSKLANLPENLWKMKCLERLDFSWISQLEEIELNGIGCLSSSSLKYLSLGWNNFVTLPATFSQLSKLESLDLSHCEQLRSVPELPSTTRYINMESCCSLEPLPALLRQSSYSRPCSPTSFRGYDESSGGVAFTILNRYLQGLFCEKTGYETATKRKEDGSKTEFQIIIPGCLVPRWLTHQSRRNSISVVLPPNWCNSRWMGFTLCALFNETVTSGFGVRVKAIGDMLHGQYFSQLFFRPRNTKHVWLLYLSRDDWFSAVGNGECTQIEVVFKGNSFFSGCLVQQCGISLVYEQDMERMEELNQANAQCSNSRVITFEGWDGFHHGFVNSKRSRDEFDD